MSSEETQRHVSPPSGIVLPEEVIARTAPFAEMPPADTYEIDDTAEGKKVGKKPKGRRYIEVAWDIVSKRDGAVCRRSGCGKTTGLTLDHIIPVQLITQMLGLLRAELYNDMENLEVLCRRCNTFKSGRLDFTNPKTKPLLLKYINLA